MALQGKVSNDGRRPPSGLLHTMTEKLENKFLGGFRWLLISVFNTSHCIILMAILFPGYPYIEIATALSYI